MAKLNQAQLDHLLTLQFALYQQQAIYLVDVECKPTMDAAQRVMRQMASDAPLPPPPPPPVSDPFADLKYRLNTFGSWAAYAPAFFTESNELIAAYPDQRETVNQINGYYGPGGFGNVHGRREGTNFYYVDILTQVWLPDVNGAADKMILDNPGNWQHVPPPVFNF